MHPIDRPSVLEGFLGVVPAGTALYENLASRAVLWNLYKLGQMTYLNPYLKARVLGLPEKVPGRASRIDTRRLRDTLMGNFNPLLHWKLDEPSELERAMDFYSEAASFVGVILAGVGISEKIVSIDAPYEDVEELPYPLIRETLEQASIRGTLQASVFQSMADAGALRSMTSFLFNAVTMYGIPYPDVLGVIDAAVDMVVSGQPFKHIWHWQDELDWNRKLGMYGPPVGRGEDPAYQLLFEYLSRLVFSYFYTLASDMLDVMRRVYEELGVPLDPYGDLMRYISGMYLFAVFDRDIKITLGKASRNMVRRAEFLEQWGLGIMALYDLPLLDRDLVCFINNMDSDIQSELYRRIGLGEGDGDARAVMVFIVLDALSRAGELTSAVSIMLDKCGVDPVQLAERLRASYRIVPKADVDRMTFHRDPATLEWKANAPRDRVRLYDPMTGEFAYFERIEGLLWAVREVEPDEYAREQAASKAYKLFSMIGEEMIEEIEAEGSMDDVLAAAELVPEPEEGEETREEP